MNDTIVSVSIFILAVSFAVFVGSFAYCMVTTGCASL